MIAHDVKDLKKLTDFFTQFCPFPDVDNITNIANGTSGDNSKITCYNAFNIGLDVMRSIEKQNFRNLKLTLATKVSYIGSEKGSSVKIGKQKYNVDNPLTFYHRICAGISPGHNMADFLKFELAPYPLALFDANGMRKTKKSTLKELFEEKAVNLADRETNFVIDGGMLLHKVHWQKNEVYRDICQKYVTYIIRNFNNIKSKNFVVFDGYNRISTKSAERQRRVIHKNSAPIRFNADMRLAIAQDKFLGNAKNKSRLITLLRDVLSEAGISSSECTADADAEIVLQAKKTAQHEQGNVIVVSEDTDVLALLAALSLEEREIFLLNPPSSKKPGVVYSSRSLASLNASMQSNILVLHAFSGCDTTSACYYRGKVGFCKLFEKSCELHEYAEKFKDENTTEDELTEAGIFLALALYGAPVNFRKQKCTAVELAEKYRLRMYTMAAAKCTGNKDIDLAKIFPTVDAWIQHFKRVFIQVRTWYGADLNPEDWGWRLEDGELEPITMTQDSGPESLSTVISCSCSTETACTGFLCGCRKHNLPCTIACKNCYGTSCTNTSDNNVAHQSDSEEEEEDEEEGE